jgi:hypothetical protein
VKAGEALSAEVLDQYLSSTLELPKFELPSDAIPESDPHDDGPTVHVAPEKMRTLAIASAEACRPSAPSYDPAIFSVTTRKCVAIEPDAWTNRFVWAVWTLAIALVVTLAVLVELGASHRITP